MRSMVPLAALGLTLPRRRWLGAPLALASAAELVYDKLPQAEERTATRPLVARVAVGGIAGGIVAHVAAASVPLGVAVGALAALASTFVSHRLRAGLAQRVPPVVAAVAGDAVAIGASVAVARRLQSAR